MRYSLRNTSIGLLTAVCLITNVTHAAYSSLPIANNGDQLSVSLWNSVLDYANKAVKQDSAILNVDSVNSRVGIGTASPTSALTISQAASNALSVNADVWYALFSGAGNGWADRLNITANAAGGGTNIMGYNNASSGYSPLNYLSAAHVFKIASVEKMRIDGFGNVGIGTSSPGQKLHVYDSVNDVALSVESWTAGKSAYSVFASPSATWRMWLNLWAGVNRFAINDLAWGNRLIIDNSWNVGIGTAAPAYRLDVNGAVNATSLLVNGVAVGAGWSQWTSGAGLIYYNGGNVGIGTASPNYRLEVRNTSTGQTAYIRSDSTSGTNYGVDAEAMGVWATTNIGWYFAATGATNNYAIIVPPGYWNVGIGTTSPKSRLDIRDAGLAVPALGTAGSGLNILRTDGATGLSIGYVNQNNGDSYLQAQRTDSANAGNLLLNPNGGNVGIGTTSPQNLLHLYNPSGSAIVRLESATNNANASIWFKSNVGGTISDRWEIGTNISATSSFELYDRLNWLSRMVVTNAGNVGIGTTSPNTKLQVLGATPASGAFNGYTGVTSGNISPLWFVPDIISSRPNPGGASQYSYRGGIGLGEGWVGIYSVNPNPAGSSYYGDIRFYTSVWNGGTLNYDVYDRMLITQSGNVGIGTANPTSPLEVVGNTNWASGWRYGITVTSNDFPTVRFRSLGVGKVSSIGNDNDGGLWFNVNGTDSTYGQLGMVVLPSGDTWIGMVPSGVKLEVNGSLRTYGNIVNQAPSQWYLALTGDLPGYSANVYPTLKTSWSTIYFSAWSQYSAYMSAGGVFTAVSDRNKKENFMPVDEKDILSRIDMLPMLKWNYKMEDPSVQHIAPIAQDFYNLFHLNGNNDKMISSIDPAGVALVGIKALSSETKELRLKVEELQKKNTELETRLMKLEETIR